MAGTIQTVLALVTEIVDWLRPAFVTAGYAVVPAAMFLESAALLGVLVPGDVILAQHGSGGFTGLGCALVEPGQ